MWRETDSDSIRDDLHRRSTRRTLTIGAGVVVVGVLVALSLPGASPVTGLGTSVALAEACADAGQYLPPGECGLLPVVTDLTAFWAQALPDSPATDYAVEVQLYSGRVQTPCGDDEDAGTYYCPVDRSVYLEAGPKGGRVERFPRLTLIDEVGTYLLAHEYGHHLQELAGRLAEVDAGGDETGPTSDSVRLELQADCYAGVFFHHAHGQLQPGTVSEKLSDAVRAGGDDEVDLANGDGIDPSAWTHGSAEQRLRWFTRGVDSGIPARCNSFDTDVL
ncbi:MAG: neutral zinc metallopeptidase [Pseudorhodobacter sp.]|nr:neutral zinc metallopeptidase [Frankiaceae bacterium]